MAFKAKLPLTIQTEIQCVHQAKTESIQTQFLTLWTQLTNTAQKLPWLPPVAPILKLILSAKRAN